MAESPSMQWRPTHRGKPRGVDRPTFVDAPKFESMGKGKKVSGNSVLDPKIPENQWPSKSIKSVSGPTVALHPFKGNTNKSLRAPQQDLGEVSTKTAAELPSYEQSTALSSLKQPALDGAAPLDDSNIVSSASFNNAEPMLDTTSTNQPFGSAEISAADQYDFESLNTISEAFAADSPTNNLFTTATTGSQALEIGQEGGADYCCFFCVEKDVTIEYQAHTIKEKEVEIRVCERTIELCHEDDDNYQDTIYELKSRLSYTQHQLKNAKRDLDTHSKHQVLKLKNDLRHAQGVNVNCHQFMKQQEDTNMDLQEKVVGQAMSMEAEKRRKEGIKKAVQRGEMSFEDAFAHLCLTDEGEGTKDLYDDESEDDDSGVDLTAEPVDAMEMM